MSDKISLLAKRIINSGLEYSTGGHIHIKPENRGKFTALKERTGHSASWFKEHGTSAQKKMAVFALNAAKWKHGDGGFLVNYDPYQKNINKYDGTSVPTGEIERDTVPMRVNADGTLVDDLTPAIYSLRDITGLRRRDIRRLAAEDALSGEQKPNLDTNTSWRRRVYDRNFNRTLLSALEQHRKQALFNAAVAELRSGEDTGAFSQLTREGVESATPIAAGIVGAAVAPLLWEGVTSLYAIPQIKTALDIVGTVDGLRNVASENGVRKTVGYIQSGDYGKAALSGIGDAFDVFGGVGLLNDAKRAIESTKGFQKAKYLYDIGNGHTVTTYSVEPWRAAARKYATKTKEFTKADRDAIRQRVLRKERFLSEERLFGGKYNEVFSKHATTPELKKIFKENPEYLYFVDKTGLDPLAQETIDLFGKQQNLSVRGVFLNKADKESIEKAMTEFAPNRANSGGDRLQSGGGVYSSNSGAIADRFQRPGDNTITDNVVSQLQYPYRRTSGSAREQLKAIRENVLNRDDWFSSTDVLLHELPPARDYRFLESEYTTRTGDVIGGAFERATTKPQEVEKITSTIQHGLPNQAGRWGIGGVPVFPEDNLLFIPKVTTRADLGKIIQGGRQTLHRDLLDDFLLNIQAQQNTRRGLIEGSLPYKIGNHVYNNTAVIGKGKGHSVYAPLLGVGATAGGAGLLSGLIVGGSQIAKESQEKSTRKLRDFRKSELYKKYIESSGGPENFRRYFEEFKKKKKEHSKE